MKEIKLASILLLAISLGGCGTAGIAVGSAAGAASVVPMVANVVGVSGTVLSDVAKAACATQQAANAAADIASRYNSAWVRNFAEISKVAGIGCSW